VVERLRTVIARSLHGLPLSDLAVALSRLLLG